MRITDRIAALRPATLTISIGAIFFASSFNLLLPFGSAAWSIFYVLAMLLLMTLVLGWHYSIYRAASDRSVMFVGHSGRRAFLFVLCAIATLLFLATFQVAIWLPIDPDNQAMHVISFAAMPAACFSYFASIWASANALVRFDEQKKHVETHKTLGSFILQFYFFIGIWFIYPRIKRMLAAPLPA